MKSTMLFTPLALAATAAAIVVPVISDVDNSIIQALPIETEGRVALPASAIFRTVEVPCAQCEGADSKLVLDFHVEHGSMLMLNGFELFPNADHSTSYLEAAVVSGDGKKMEQRLGYGLAVQGDVDQDQDEHMRLIVELEIIQVGGRFVDDVPTVRLKLTQTSTEGLRIGDVVQEEASETECSSVLCRAKGMFAELSQAIRMLKGCAGDWLRIKGPQHPGAPQDKAEQQDGTGFVPIHGSRPDGHTKGRHHGHHYNWRQLLRNIASHIFLPVLMGVTAGVAVAGVAMVLCSLVIRLARFAKSRRAHGARCCRKKQASHRQVADEKVGLMEAVCEEQPPQYEDETSKN